MYYVFKIERVNCSPPTPDSVRNFGAKMLRQKRIFRRVKDEKLHPSGEKFFQQSRLWILFLKLAKKICQMAMEKSESIA